MAYDDLLKYNVTEYLIKYFKNILTAFDVKIL